MRMGLALLVTVALLPVDTVRAELRVLFRFDDTGTHVYRLYQVDDDIDLQNSTGSSSADASSKTDAVLTWLDANGDILAVTRVPDPRMAYSPGHVEGTGPSRIGLLTGAWVASGPDRAESVVVTFPERASLSLAPEIWTLSLSVTE